MATPITAIDALQGVVVAVGGAASAASTVLISAPSSVPTLGFFDADAVESTMTGDGLYLTNLAADTAALSLVSQALAFHTETKDASYGNTGMNLYGGSYTIGVGELDGFPSGLNIVTPGTVEHVNVSSTTIDLVNAGGKVAYLHSDELSLVASSADAIDLSVPAMQLSIAPNAEVATIYGRSTATLYAAGGVESAILDATTGLQIGRGGDGGYTVQYKPTGLYSTASLDISAAGVTFAGLAGTADQYLASSGADVCPVWKDIPAPPASPLMMYGYAFPAASSGSPVWADIGEARTFLYEPLVMLQAMDSGGLVIPVTLTNVSTLGFSWVASSAIVRLVVSVYSIG